MEDGVEPGGRQRHPPSSILHPHTRDANQLTSLQERWLDPLNPFQRTLRCGLYWTNWLGMRMLFRLRVIGRKHLPDSGPLVFVPNHTSSLDAFALAAAISYGHVKQTWWAGWSRAVLRGWLRRRINRLAQVVPVQKSLSSLAVGEEVLRRGRNLVWFPEGHRSRDGHLQEFKSGIGLLVQKVPVTIVPMFISGAREAMPPPRRRLVRLSRVLVAIGPPLPPSMWPADADAHAIAEAVRERVAALAPPRAAQRAESRGSGESM
ncbi:MAG: 1-acyl-sn-glycerol-3-phosphate acyltransferase [Planctomycetes bacterium]|nr:1-acyl-sn-glycerol-3-phosphate acyltransferase [Planctomycetota bacterium]